MVIASLSDQLNSKRETEKEMDVRVNRRLFFEKEE
jgi:hypothetical protein